MPLPRVQVPALSAPATTPQAVAFGAPSPLVAAPASSFFRAWQNAAQTITNVTVTTIVFDQVDSILFPNAFYSTTTGQLVLSSQTIYIDTARVGFRGVAGINRAFLSLYVNATERRRGTDNAGTASGSQNAYIHATLFPVVDFNANDLLTIRLFQDTGGNNPTQTGRALTYLEVEMV